MPVRRVLRLPKDAKPEEVQHTYDDYATKYDKVCYKYYLFHVVVNVQARFSQFNRLFNVFINIRTPLVDDGWNNFFRGCVRNWIGIGQGVCDWNSSGV
jgi:hypothetical protein